MLPNVHKTQTAHKSRQSRRIQTVIVSGQIDESSTAKYMMLTFSILSKSSGRLSISLLGNLEFLKCSIKASLPCTRPYFTSHTCMKNNIAENFDPQLWKSSYRVAVADWVIPCFFAFIWLITLLVWHTWVVVNTATCLADSWLCLHRGLQYWSQIVSCYESLFNRFS